MNKNTLHWVHSFINTYKFLKLCYLLKMDNHRTQELTYVILHPVAELLLTVILSIRKHYNYDQLEGLRITNTLKGENIGE